MIRLRCRLGFFLLLAVLELGFFSSKAQESDGVEFFEKRIRPVLIERCFHCHSAGSEKLKGGLRLDSRVGLLRGGDTGPAVVPGKPEASALVGAIRYGNQDLQMPPKGKLLDSQIADFVEWVKIGVPWPEEASEARREKSQAFDLEHRRGMHWAWRPIARPPLPMVGRLEWSGHPVDRFILGKLELQGLAPAPAAEARTLIRRLYFDLLGLPPSPAEVSAFIADQGPGAYERLVDRLLGSPAFGERWARHWLDLVRYADTLGHEFDYPMPNAWHYRDYVIRALNADLPYDQFVKEHLAGDLLPNPRFSATSANESIIGTAFFWLGQQVHSPVDVRMHQAEVIENQIDVLGKTFLGLTIACARCHDHKFDAISTKDYYALYGVLSSSRYAQRAVNSPSLEERIERLRRLRGEVRTELGKFWLEQCETLEKPADDVGRERAESEAGPASEMLAAWINEGPAFEGLIDPGALIIPEAGQPFRLAKEPSMHSGATSFRLEGTLRSPTWAVTNAFLHLRAAGRESRINVFVDNFAMIQDPIYGGLRRVLDSDDFRWLTIDLRMWLGHRVYVEVSDMRTPDLAGGGKAAGYGPNGWAAISRVVFSDEGRPPPSGNASMAWPKDDRTFRSAAAEAVRAWTEGSLGVSSQGAAQASLLTRLLAAGRLANGTNAPMPPALKELLLRFRDLESSLPEPVRVPAQADGSGLDEPVFIRGNPRTPGELVPRRFLEALGGAPENCFQRGSGRIELAEAIVAPGNPLLARVMVNRVWLHLFGRGIVPTPDDFGAAGQPPTHAELLDWLADSFRSEMRWSIKRLIRMLVTSNAYRMSSHPSDPVSEEKDPSNLWFHRMPVRRLEGEAIRDAMLSLAGRLDPSLLGKPVPAHINEFMDGRGRPARSGPLDGDGRRSIYLEVRRNFLSPLMRAFDTPVPFTTIGRRTISNVPAQSLILMNDPLVVAQAALWAKRALDDAAATVPGRISRLYEEAYARPATAGEISEAVDFLKEQGADYGLASDAWERDARVWADLCHVLLNVKEFVFVN